MGSDSTIGGIGNINGLERRSFLKLSGTIASCVALSGTSGVLKAADSRTAGHVGYQTGTTVIPTSCAHDCGGRCVLRAHVKDGVITRFDTDQDPDTWEAPQLRACWRGRSYRKKVYSPFRIKYPMRFPSKLRKRFCWAQNSAGLAEYSSFITLP